MITRLFSAALLAALSMSCAPDAADVVDTAGSGTPDDGGLARPENPQPSPGLDACGFGYHKQFAQTTAITSTPAQRFWQPRANTPERIDVVHPEPLPETTWTYSRWFSTEGLTMPGYTDNMPLFERAASWATMNRCYETPNGARFLTESEAYTLYVEMAELTTGVEVDTRDGVRTVIGIRGAYPGTFQWHGNTPNQFNDTLILIWQEDATPHVREFPVNTDTGAVYFGYHSASSLRPNRRYNYINGWHRSYNAPQMYEWSYRVADDSNGNGHWDRTRNGWYSGGAIDHERPGGAHNIHMASVDGPLGEAKIENWSAGCQVIPGSENWIEFLGNAWTNDGDDLNYFLLDSRDIDHRVWKDCEPDGSHECPYEITRFPATISGDTSVEGTSEFDEYDCSTADESGHELVYFFTVDRSGDLTATIDCDAGVDIDIHLLDGDDSNACLSRGHTELRYDLTPGRYYIVADTWVDGNEEQAGAFTLNLEFN